MARRIARGHFLGRVGRFGLAILGWAARCNPTAERPPGFGRFGSWFLQSVFNFSFDCPKRPKATGGNVAGTGRGLGALGHLGGLGYRFSVAPKSYLITILNKEYFLVG